MIRTERQPGQLRSGIPRDHRALLVWISVLLGALAAEVFAVSIIWQMVERSGPTGALYLVPQLAGGAVSGLVGGAFLDRFPPLRVTLGAEVIRVAAAAFAFTSVAVGWPIWTLIAVGMMATVVRPHHDACVMSGLSRLGLDQQSLQAASALVDNTLRIARIAGPALAAGLALLVGPNAVLLVAAILFFAAFAAFLILDRIARTNQSTAEPVASEQPPSRSGALRRSFDIVQRSRFMLYTLISQAINAGAWYLGFVFCVALLLSARTESDTGLGGFGLAMLCYGLGNVACGLTVARHRIGHPARYVIVGRAVAALGYLLLAADQHLWWLCAMAALTAAGTPIADLAFIARVQRDYRWDDVAKLFRFKLIAEYTGMLVALACGSLMIGRWGVTGTIRACGLVLLVAALVGGYGLWAANRRTLETDSV